MCNDWLPMRKEVASNRMKPHYDRAIKVHISLPPTLDGRKNELCRKLGFSSFSHYIQSKMRADLSLAE